jgi:hypothetical protein
MEADLSKGVRVSHALPEEMSSAFGKGHKALLILPAYLTREAIATVYGI